MNRSKLLLLLGIILGTAVYYAWETMPVQQHAVAPSQTLKPAPILQRRARADEAQTSWEKTPEPGVFHPPRRSLFGPLYQKKLIAPQRTQPAMAAATSQKQPDPVVSDKSQLQANATPWAVLGYLEKSGRYTLFLSSGTDTGKVFIVKEHEQFADDFQVKSITAQQVIICQTSSPQEQVIAMRKSENQHFKQLLYQSGRTPLSNSELERLEEQDSNHSNEKLPTKPTSDTSTTTIN